VFLRNGGDDYQNKRRHSPHTTNRNPDTAITDLAFINTEIKSNYTICRQDSNPGPNEFKGVITTAHRQINLCLSIP